MLQTSFIALFHQRANQLRMKKATEVM